MLPSSFKRMLVDRLRRGARDAGERGLALLITAGVVSCGGQTTPPADASTDAPQDGTVITEAPAYDGAVPEAPAYDGGSGSDASDAGVIIEAPAFDASNSG